MSFMMYIIPSKILAKVKLYFTLAINQVMVKLVKKRYKVKKKRLFKTSLFYDFDLRYSYFLFSTMETIGVTRLKTAPPIWEIAMMMLPIPKV